MAELTGIQTRDHKGRSMRTPETIARDHQAAEMRSKAMTYQQIGEALGISRQAAHKAVQRAIDEIPKEGTEQVLSMELQKLDYLERRLFKIVEDLHVTIARSGKIVMYDDGTPVPDEAPVIQAIAALLRVGDRRSKLLGLNAPAKAEVDVTIQEHAGEVDRAIWERAIEFERWRSAKQTVVDLDVTAVLDRTGEAGADPSGD